ncbi:MAG: carboxypeptidase-like regulatory domain-containing protein [Paludibacter sp.]|nr:carboxypeptidase-like regulatory domain-containing protein [Paludibacter sp.]
MKHVLFLMLLIAQTALTQVKIIDSRKGDPIAFAHVIICNGKLGATSDMNGNISICDLSKMVFNDSSKFTIQHIAYENKELTLGELKKMSEIKLKERTILLQEISILPNQIYDYVLIKGLFRSYQLNNGIPKYFTDGIVEYYIPKKGNGFSFCLLEHRSFRNVKLIESIKNRSISMVMKLAGIPYIESGILLNDIKSKYSLNEIGTGKEIILLQSKVGFIKENPEKQFVQIFIDKVAPNNELIKSLFGYTSRIKNINLTENYLCKDFKNLSKNLLESRKEYRKLYFKNNKDMEEEEIEGIHEFFTMDITYITKKQFKTIKTETDTSLKESHSYESEYWINLPKENNFPPLSQQIENELYKTLIMY